MSAAKAKGREGPGNQRAEDTQPIDEHAADTNAVRLVGRLAAPPTPTVLPSGDTVATFRIVVRRPSLRQRGTARSPSVDTLECAAWRADVRRSVGSWRPGDVVEVEGSLRRRFWRAAAGAASRYEVEVDRARRVSRAA